MSRRWLVPMLFLWAVPRMGASEATNWVLPIFTDQEGFRSLTARGSAIRPQPDNSVAVTDLSITVFSGDAKEHVDTVMLSRQASFWPKQMRASGTDSVRIIRDDLEATGKNWTYDHAQKHVTLHGDVRIIFNAQIHDLLK